MSSQAPHRAIGLRLALGCLIVAATVRFFTVPAVDNDLWGHVLFGRQILAEGLPERNGYAYTEPNHPWLNHEIIAECILAWTFDRFGSPGLLLVKWLLGLATIGFVGAICQSRGVAALPTALALVLASSLMAWGYLSRPQIFTYAFLAALWAAIDRFARRGDARGLWAAPPIVAIWVNTHGGVLAGVAVLGLALALLAVTDRARDRATAAVILAASIAALLVNPYGVDLLRFLVEDVTIDRPITEWAAVPLLDLSNFQFKIACAVLVFGVVFLPVPRRTWELAVLLAAAVGAFRHERHLPLFAVLSAPLLAELVGAVIRRARFEEPSLGAARSLAASTLVVAVAIAAPTVAQHREHRFQLFVSPASYPIGAVRFIREKGWQANLAVPFGWGEYVLWHLPNCPVSIDGRYTTAYSTSAIEAAWKYMDGSDGWDLSLAGATLALTDARHATAYRLKRHPEWRLVYSDPTASVFARRGVTLPNLPEQPIMAPPAPIASFP